MCNAKVFGFKIICLFAFVSSSQSLYNYTSRVARQIVSQGCYLPKQPRHGQWTIYHSHCQQSTETISSNWSISQPRPKTLVPLGTVLQVSCQGKYKLIGDVAIVCINGQWTNEIGKCLKTCPSIYSTPLMKVTCVYAGNIEKENCTDAVSGTIARFRCSDFYEDLAVNRRLPHKCDKGKWSGREPECVPRCGKKFIKQDPRLIVGGYNAHQGDYPWQVALYTIADEDLICSGSLINQRVILTAAHCVTSIDGKVESEKLYTVAAGKYYRKLNDSRDFNKAQFSSLHKIYISGQYRGHLRSYEGDIAILITKKTFSLSSRVQPVCVLWNSKDRLLLNPKKTTYGYVSGWGYTVEFTSPSDVLKELKVPVINNDKCERNLPDEYIEYMTVDKLCAGDLNSNMSVCRGDSGGGLVVRDENNRYYIVGIVSISPQAPTAEGGCNSNQYGLYTQVSYYTENFIVNKEVEFRPSEFGEKDCDDYPDDPDCNTVTTPTAPTSEMNCVLPPHPISGQWAVVGNNSSLTPGMLVSSNTILRFSCKSEHNIIGSEFIFCINGKWSAEFGRCSKMCPPLYNTVTTEVTCSFNKEERKTCNNSVEGTIAKYQCASFYENLDLAKNPVRICRNGLWDQVQPECTPICGKKSSIAQPLIINGQIVKKSDYPWQAALYTKTDKFLICGGSIINQRVILTAAHCVSENGGNPKQINDYLVAAGKHYRQYDDPRDKNEAQFSELHGIFLPEQYRGYMQNYLGDIAILVTKNLFVLSRNVQPICLDRALSYDLTPDKYGYIIGWGFTSENSMRSDVLRELKVPYISSKQCRDSLPEDYEIFLTYDKFCAGYLNNGSSIGKGDTGGGLVIEYDGRFYVVGIASLSPMSRSEHGGVDSQQYSVYTKVSSYMKEFILKKEIEFRP